MPFRRGIYEILIPENRNRKGNNQLVNIAINGRKSENLAPDSMVAFLHSPGHWQKLSHAGDTRLLELEYITRRVGDTILLYADARANQVAR